MADHRMRLVLAAGLMFIMTALTAMQTLADAGVELSLEGFEEAGLIAASEDPPAPTPTPAMPSFSERLAAAGSPDALVDEAPDGWVPVVAGIDYQLFVESGPNKVHVARMARANTNLFLETSIGQGRTSGGVERTSSQFARYEGAINYWGQTWGGTNDVIVAINGSFYDVNGVPDRGMIHSGWYAKRFTNNQSGSGFVWKHDRTAFIGQCVTHTASKQVLTFVTDGGSVLYQGINVARGSDELIVYTPQFDSSTDTDDSGIEIVVRMDRPAMVLPPPSSMAAGTVVAVRDLNGNSSMFFDYVVLSATGAMRDVLKNTLQVGDRIGISSSITNFKSDCATPLAVDWTKAYASLGGSYYFLQDGVITAPPSTPANPLTAIAFNNDYLFFIVVDGRDPGVSVGMTIDQLAAFVKNKLGATWGINQDGGGSSTMVIDGAVVNTPSDLTTVACKQIFLPVIIGGGGSGPSGGLPESESELQLPECVSHVERAVANGIMMVAYQPAAFSTLFTESQSVATTAQATLRLGPGSNYASLATVASGTNGTIQVHSGGLNGVYAKGTYWWLVKFGGQVGWVSENALGP